MSINYKSNRQWSDHFIGDFKRIASESLGVKRDSINVSEPIEDRKHNTDLICMDSNGTRIACRVRKAEFMSLYSDEFTIRYRMASGADTEFQKIVTGWGDYMIYGFANQEETGIIKWITLDLNVLREWFKAHDVDKKSVFRNVDGSSYFVALNWRNIPDIVIKQYGHRSG